MKRTKLRIREVKRNAKQGLGNYYGKALVASILVMVMSFAVVLGAMIPMFAMLGVDSYAEFEQMQTTEALVGQTQTIDPTAGEAVAAEDSAVAGVMSTSYLVMLAIIFFVISPLMVGYNRFFLRAREGDAKVGNIFSFFKKGYWRSVGYYALYVLKTVAWEFIGYLMVIPGLIMVMLATETEIAEETAGILALIGLPLLIAGVVGMIVLLFNKSYKYMMGMYALADNPEMSVSDAFKAGKIIAKGNVGRLLLLQLSYFLWILLSAIVPYVGQILVMPLVYAGVTEGYVFLKSAAIDRGELSAADFAQLTAGESSEIAKANN